MVRIFVLSLTVLLSGQVKEVAAEDALPRVQGLGGSVQLILFIKQFLRT